MNTEQEKMLAETRDTVLQMKTKIEIILPQHDSRLSRLEKGLIGLAFTILAASIATVAFG